MKKIYDSPPKRQRHTSLTFCRHISASEPSHHPNLHVKVFPLHIQFSIRPKPPTRPPVAHSITITPHYRGVDSNPPLYNCSTKTTALITPRCAPLFVARNSNRRRKHRRAVVWSLSWMVRAAQTRRRVTEYTERIWDEPWQVNRYASDGPVQIVV